jgi:hypothetical protein
MMEEIARGVEEELARAA